MQEVAAGLKRKEEELRAREGKVNEREIAIKDRES